MENLNRGGAYRGDSEYDIDGGDIRSFLEAGGDFDDDGGLLFRGGGAVDSSTSSLTALSRQLFEAVATHNHPQLLQLYAAHTRASLWKYSSTKQRWNSWIPTTTTSTSTAAGSVSSFDHHHPRGRRPDPPTTRSSAAAVARGNRRRLWQQQASSISGGGADEEDIIVDDEGIDDVDEDDLVWTARLRQQQLEGDAEEEFEHHRSSRQRGRMVSGDGFDYGFNDDDFTASDAGTLMPQLTDATTVVSSSTRSTISTASMLSSSSSSSASTSTNPIAVSSFSSFLSFRPTTSTTTTASTTARIHKGSDERHAAADQASSSAHYRLLKELAQLVSTKADLNHSNHHKSKKIEVDVETERLLRDAAAQLTEVRPPPDLVVHPQQNPHQQQSPNARSTRRRRLDNDDEASSNGAPPPPPVTPDRNDRTVATTGNSRPPVFDGAVALSTPAGPPHGAAAHVIPSGGSGTILHLACAVDSPLALAFLLAMGGNPRATHTAFRRMMVHEAACNGSYQCLTLLLELGHEFATQQQPVIEHGNNAASTHAATAAPAQAPTLMEQLDLPFLPRRMDRADALAPLQLYLRPFVGHQYHAATSNSSYYFGSSASSSPPPPPPPASSSSSSFVAPPFLQRTAFSSANGPFSTPSTGEFKSEHSSQGDDMDFVAILHLFKSCCAQVQDGTISELDAARRIIKTAMLDADSRAALATSCGFLPPLSSSQSVDLEEQASAPVVSSRRHLAESFLWRSRPGSARNRAVGTRATAPAAVTVNSSGAAAGAAADGHGNTPLHWAAFKNEVDCVRLLLKYRANPNAKASPSGWTPLHDAAYSNSVETIALLLDAGAHVDARANSGATPLCFAAQEDAAGAAELLLERGADLSARCSPAGAPRRPGGVDGPNNHGGGPNGRFSGYTPLHYCAHYNAHRAARVLLKHPTARIAMEVADLSDRLPIHVAVARGSSDVLRELLHAGARVETRTPSFPSSTSSVASASAASSSAATTSTRRRRLRSENGPLAAVGAAPSHPGSAPSTPNRQRPRPLPPTPERRTITPRSSRPGSRASSSTTTTSTGIGSTSASSTPVSSPVLRSMIPAQPVTSSKPWNCLTQQSIDECRALISEAEQSWAPDRHELFTPEDRRAVMELLRVGKRLEIQGTGLHVQALWPTVLSFCGRGWFEADEGVVSEEGDAVDVDSEGSSSSLSRHDDDVEATSDTELDYLVDAAAATSMDATDDSLTLPSL